MRLFIFIKVPKSKCNDHCSQHLLVNIEFIHFPKKRKDLASSGKSTFLIALLIHKETLTYKIFILDPNLDDSCII